MNKSERVHKNINKYKEEKSIDEIEDEEPLVTDNSVIGETSYFNLLKCG